MCGICGYMSKNRISEDELRAMNETMLHRGPDDGGVELYPSLHGYCVGLAQRRLSIQDLSPLGHQPMSSADGRLSVVFNGEIYNFLELREELSDYPFRSHCDTEVILASYLRWGESFVDHIHGMFAIAIFDRETDSLILSRDRIGKKPLYYWLHDMNLVFASQLTPLMLCPGFDKRINTGVIPRYLYQQYINAPDTIFRDVYQLEPGHTLIFKDGKVRNTGYWSVRDAYAKAQIQIVTDYNEAKDGLKIRLKNAVKRRMIADVPLGCFLSGGYDSSLISAIAQESSSTPVRTFSIGFEEAEYNEAGYAKQVASHLGTDHTELIIGEKDMLDLVHSIAAYYDEPFADSSQIPTMLVCSLARKDVTVALSGDGGDEFFCGYNIYEHIGQAAKLDRLGAVADIIGRLPVPGGPALMDKMPFKVQLIAGNRDPETKVQLASENYIREAQAFMYRMNGMQDKENTPHGNGSFNNSIVTLPCKYPVESSYAGIIARSVSAGVSDSLIRQKLNKSDAWQIRRMLLDMDTYLPGDILVKMDRASMKYSLECRCPIMDTEVMEYSYRIPHRFKYMNGDKKHILKDIAFDYIPRELLDRPKKGFGVPLDKWLRGPLRQELTDYSDISLLRKQGIFDADHVSSFMKGYLDTGDAGRSTGANFSGIAWSFYVFQQWYESHINALS